MMQIPAYHWDLEGYAAMASATLEIAAKTESVRELNACYIHVRPAVLMECAETGGYAATTCAWKGYAVLEIHVRVERYAAPTNA